MWQPSEFWAATPFDFWAAYNGLRMKQGKKEDTVVDQAEQAERFAEFEARMSAKGKLQEFRTGNAPAPRKKKHPSGAELRHMIGGA